MNKVRFKWDEEKNRENQKKHGVPFSLAQYAFADPSRVIAEDVSHSQTEQRDYCFCKSWRTSHDGTVHLPQGQDPNHRSGILA